MNTFSPSPHILIIDDDLELCELLREYLGPEGFIVESIDNAAQGLKRALSGEHTMVILDVMLPQGSGFEVLRKIRATSDIPVLMLTARGDEIDRIVGLEMGADDYVAKPFSPRELTARLRAISRRVSKPDPIAAATGPGATILVGDLALDPGTRTVTKSGQTVILTSAEFCLLQHLLLEAGKAVSRERLAEQVLGRKLMMFDRSVDVHISSLRKKLGNGPDGSERIKTIRGVGYLYTTGTVPSRYAG